MRFSSFLLKFLFLLFIPLQIFAQSPSNSPKQNPSAISSNNSHYVQIEKSLSNTKAGQNIQLGLNSGEKLQGCVLFYDDHSLCFLANGYASSINFSDIKNVHSSNSFHHKLKNVAKNVVLYPPAIAFYGVVVLPPNFIAYIQTGAFREMSFRRFLRL